MTVAENASIDFSQFGNSFQEKIIQALMVDNQWATQISEVINVDYFDSNYLKVIAKSYFDFYKLYKTFPSTDMLVTYIKDSLKRTEGDKSIYNQVIMFITNMKMNKEICDLGFVKNKTLDFCKRQALKSALEKSIELMAVEQYEDIVDTIKTAIHIGTSNSLGHDFQNDLEVRFSEKSRIVVATGIPQLDAKYILNGGHGNGELGIVVAPSGVGKSQFLVQLGANAIREGKNVVYYTLELSENAIAIRFDSNFCQIDSNDVRYQKEEVIQHYKDHPEYGRLFIKEYPMNFATVDTFRNHLERLSMMDFIPDLIIIDYADVMRASQHYDTLRFELRKTYEDLKAFAKEVNVPIWSASQSNKAGANEDIVQQENMAEAYGKAAVCDLIIGLSRRPEEKATGKGRFFIAKNRAGRDGLIFNIFIDTSMSTFTVTEEEKQSIAELKDKREKSNAKKELRDVWNSINKDANGTNNHQQSFSAEKIVKSAYVK